jgi:peptidoglycan hydrolase-like protein with peptidoglycan-binding domain
MTLTNPRFSSCAELRAASENSPPLKAGKQGECVEILQQALIDLGFAMPVSTGAGDHAPDGIYGRETSAAVRDFQRRHGLQVDGEAGRQTLKKLEELIDAAASSDEVKFRREMKIAVFVGK